MNNLLKKRIAVASFALALASSPVWADVYPKHVKGDDVEKRTTEVVQTEEWADSLDGLLARAKDEKKLVFWLQLVGSLDGGL